MILRRAALILLLAGNAAGARAAEEPKLRLDLTLLDVPFNTARGDAFPGMAQSLVAAKSVYSAVHYGIQKVYAPNHPILSGLFTGLADIYLEWLPPGDAWLHEEFHRAVMRNRGISSYND